MTGEFNLTDNSSISDQIKLLRRFMNGVGYLELCICIIGTPANALVFYLAITIATRTGSSNGGKQQWFVASMTAADFIFTSVHSPMFYALYTLGRPFHVASCSVFYLASHIAIVASSLSLLLINVDKFVALYKPLHYKILMTTRRVSGALIGCWIMSIFWAIFLVFGPFLTVTENCNARFRPGYQVAYYVFTVIFFAVPVFASVSIAVFVTGIARKSRMSNLVLKAGTGMRIASRWFLEMEVVPDLDPNPAESRRSAKERKKSAKAIGFVVTTTLWSAFTLLPYRFAFILNLSGYTGVLWPSILLTLMTMNALGNPFITIVTQKQYQRRLIRLWNRLLCRHSLVDDVLSQQVAATIRILCQQQEQLLTMATRRTAKQNLTPLTSVSTAGKSSLTLTRSIIENPTSPGDTMEDMSG